MKKLILTAAIAVFGFTGAMAQEFSFGPKAGVNFATLTGDIENNDMKIGFHVGGAAEFKFNEKMGVQAELLYSAQGTKYEESESFGGVTAKYEEKLKLDYVNIPFSFKYYIVNGFNVSAGPQVGILVSAKSDWEETITGGGLDQSDSGEVDIKDSLKPIDFAFNLGLGYKMDNGLNFDARYSLGLMDISDFDNSNGEIKNGVIQLSVGFMF